MTVCRMCDRAWQRSARIPTVGEPDVRMLRMHRARHDGRLEITDPAPDSIKYAAAVCRTDEIVAM